MTTEEKAIAYDEALKRAKAAMDIAADKDLVGEVVRTIFPELNDDERIRNGLIKLLTVASEAYLVESTGIKKDSYLAWLEKQKEQKPNIELIQRSWYMEGYHDREFGKEPKWVIKTGEGGPKHELNPRYGELLTEQRPTEEQLHNLNEAIKSFRVDGFDRIADSLHSLYNILKTQEQHPSSKYLPRDWVVYDGPLGHAILQIKDVVDGRYTFVDNDSTLLEEDSDKFLRPLTPKDVEMKEEWKPSEEQMSMLLAVINDPNNAGAESCYMALKSIYNNLKKL